MHRGQYLDLDNLVKQDMFLGNDEKIRPDGNPYGPAQVVSAIDVDRSPPMCMDTPMSDMCPECGGNCMRVGDYVCWGRCFRCYDESCAALAPILARIEE